MDFRLAEAVDAPMVARVLSAAAAKLVQRGDALWTADEVSERSVEPHVRAGLFHLGLERGEVIGVFRLQLEDRTFWPEAPVGTSAYLHKLAILPGNQGRGLAHELLRHAVCLTREMRLQSLRLDCMACRPKLRAVYETFGFKHHSKKQMGAQMFHGLEFDVVRVDA
jgi:GNAT superfamily N-acetyltransferase